MSSLELAGVGQIAHLGVVVGVVLGFVHFSDRWAVSDDPTQRRQQRLTLVAVIGLFGGAFRFTPFGIDGRLTLAGLSLILAIGCALSVLRVSDAVRGMRTPGPLRWMALYGAAAVPSVVVASDPLAAIGGAAGVLALVVVALAVGSCFDVQSIRRLLGLLAASAVVVATSSALLTASSAFQTIRSPVLPRRLVGWFPFVELGWGHLGVGLAIIAIQRRRFRLPAGLAAVALIVATQARGAAIALVVVGIAWVILERRRWLPAGLALLLVVGLAGTYVDPIRNLWDREQAAIESDSIFTYRADFVRAAIGVAERSPVIGRGLDSGTVDDFSEELTVGRADLVTSTHMVWTTALAGTGAAGLIAMLVVFASAWRWAIRRWRPVNDRTPVAWPVLVMAWMSVSSFFLVGPAELSAQAIAFAVGVLAMSMADAIEDENPASQKEPSVRAR